MRFGPIVYNELKIYSICLNVLHCTSYSKYDFVFVQLIYMANILCGVVDECRYNMHCKDIPLVCNQMMTMRLVNFTMAIAPYSHLKKKSTHMNDFNTHQLNCADVEIVQGPRYLSVSFHFVLFRVLQ